VAISIKKEDLNDFSWMLKKLQYKVTLNAELDEQSQRLLQKNDTDQGWSIHSDILRHLQGGLARLILSSARKYCDQAVRDLLLKGIIL